MQCPLQRRLFKTSIAAMTGISLLAACSSAPVGPAVPGIVNVAYSQVYMDGSRLKEIPTEVMIVKRSDTARNVAAQVGITAVTLLFGGFGVAGQGFSKDGLKGAPIDGIDDRNHIQNPVSTSFVASLQAKIDQVMQGNAAYQGKSFSQPIFVTGGRAALIYENLGNDEEKFRLKTDLVIYKTREKKNVFSPNPHVKVDCGSASPQPLSQEEWAKDNYRLVKTELESMLSACEKKVLADLPKLLKS